MSIIYLLSVSILLAAFILVKKSEKTIDIISFICISIVTLFCYNTFVCYILTFFLIPNTLLILSIINIIISFVFIVLMIIKKETQKFSFKKIDIIYIIMIVICVLIVSYINFGIPFNINYETGDSATHYLASTMFARSNFLLGAKQEYDPVHGTLNTLRPAAYVNSGILMKCFCIDMNLFECYNIFVFFEIFILFLIGISIYSAMKSFAKNKEHLFFAFILSLICMLGYPLNSLIFGFEYLTLGLLIICTIIDLINYYNTESMDIKFFIPIMALVNFGLFLSYYMLVVFAYPAQWIYFCINNYNKTKKIITKKLITILGVTLLIPFALGYIYSIAPNIYTIFIDKTIDIDRIDDVSISLLNSGFKTDGYIYINLYSNMVLLLPLPIYLFISDIKNKNTENNVFSHLLIIFSIAFIALLLIGNNMGKVSMYYLSKIYFALWIILLYCNYKTLILLSQNGNYLPRLFLTLYVLLMIICTLCSNVNVGYRLNNPYENVLAVMDIFGANKDLLLNKQEELNQEELEILKYVKYNIDNNSQIEIISDENTYYWQYALLQHLNKEDEEIKYNGQKKLIYKHQFLENKLNEMDYIVCFYKSEKYNKLKDKLLKNTEIIYENEAGAILKYNR